MVRHSFRLLQRFRDQIAEVDRRPYVQASCTTHVCARLTNVSSRAAKKYLARRGQSHAVTPAASADTAELIQYSIEGTTASLTFEAAKLPPPTHSLAVDCGIARVRRGDPELLFAQLSPFDDTEIQRLLVIRYTPERFIARANENQSFTSNLKEHLRQSGARGEAGEFVRLFEAAQPTRDCVFSIVDAEIESAAYATGRGGITFYSVPTYDMHLAIHGHVKSLHFVAAIQATMPVRALLDVLLSWSNIAKELPT